MATERTDDPWVPLDVPVDVPRTSSSVVDWLDPVHRKRYQPRAGNTYCNIFAWDWSKAMGVEIPHIVDGQEMTINATIQWLKDRGPARGWFPGAGINGEPSIVTWRNPDGHGHVAVVREQGADRWASRYAQAGASCYADAPLASCFSRPRWQFLLWFHARRNGGKP